VPQTAGAFSFPMHHIRDAVVPVLRELLATRQPPEDEHREPDAVREIREIVEGADDVR
jgi:hypothetical protein